MDKKKKRGRPRIRTAEYWREYYTRKQREWRAAHLYHVSHDAVIRVFDEGGNVIETRRPNRRVHRAVSRTRKTKSRHAARRNGSLRN
jgi:hypothetical protein